MDIGTAKTPVAERRGLPHHLIDVIDPDQIFTAGEYQRAARVVLGEIAARGRVPVVVGGTGFYLEALLTDCSRARLQIPRYGPGWRAVRNDWEKF